MRQRYSFYSWGVRITPGGVGELPFEFIHSGHWSSRKIDEKIGPLSTMKLEKQKITVLEICGKEHTFQRALDNSREPKDVIDAWKKIRGEGVVDKKLRFQSLSETKNGKNTHLQVSDGKTRGLEVLVGGWRVYG